MQVKVKEINANYDEFTAEYKIVSHDIKLNSYRLFRTNDNNSNFFYFVFDNVKHFAKFMKHEQLLLDMFTFQVEVADEDRIDVQVLDDVFEIVE